MEYAIVLLPLLGSVISGFFGEKLGSKLCQILTSLFVSISAILSFLIFYKVLVEDYSSNKLIFSWITSGDFNVNWDRWGWVPAYKPEVSVPSRQQIETLLLDLPLGPSH